MQWESNPHSSLGRRGYYHYTMHARPQRESNPPAPGNSQVHCHYAIPARRRGNRTPDSPTSRERDGHFTIPLRPPGGIEPPSLPPKGRIIPLYHGDPCSPRDLNSHTVAALHPKCNVSTIPPGEPGSTGNRTQKSAVQGRRDTTSPSTLKPEGIEPPHLALQTSALPLSYAFYTLAELNS